LKKLLSELAELAQGCAIGYTEYDTLALPVHYAASTGNIYILRRLLEAGLEADNVLVEDGWTALFHAARAGHEEVLRILINDYCADVNRRANKGTVAIHTAAYHNHGKCVEAFLDAGLDVNVRGRAGRTSLHWAAHQGSIDAVRVLLERGANVFIEEKDTFMKAADIAKVKALEVSESKKSEFRWKEPCEENYEPILKMLEDQAARCNIDRTDATALPAVD
ncbi:Ankyrin-2, partial [Xylographa soralifera]|nr:Ankyrin-2 [Xylographa soralifera]